MRKGFRFSVLLCLSTLALHAGFLDEENVAISEDLDTKDRNTWTLW